jgi:pyridoxine 4-dehydrogenase
MRMIGLFLLCASVASTSAWVAPSSHAKRDDGSLYATTSRRDFFDQAAAVAGTVASSTLWLPSANAAVAPSIDLPPMGLGAWAWGDPVFWGYNPKEDEELRRVFDYAVANSKSGKTLFDTAELYGFGRSESLLGEFSRDSGDKVQIASKFAAFPFRTDATSVVKACEASVKRLGRPIDLYQIHFPNAWSNAEYWDGLAMVYEKGLVKSVGVSNYGSDAVRACHKALAERGIPLATNQIQCSLLYPWPEKNGLLDTCKELDVKVLAYSPLALGYLTGKYTAEKLPGGPRKSIGQKLFSTPDFANLLDTMKLIAASHSPDATLSQVAVNWTRAKGTIPIPGARTISQVKQNYGALDWDMSAKEVEMLDEAAAKVHTFLLPDQNPFPKEDINTKLKMYES